MHMLCVNVICVGDLCSHAAVSTAVSNSGEAAIRAAGAVLISSSAHLENAGIIEVKLAC